MRFYTTLLLLIAFCIACSGQKDDTLRKYLDKTLAFTNKKNAIYAAAAIKDGDHWLLFAVYPDTGVLLKAYFKDKDLTIKDGPFGLFHPNHNKAMEGYYENNVQQGTWKYWYNNGQLRDSGMVKNNQMMDRWYSFYENGQLMTIAEYLPTDSIRDDVVFFAVPQKKKTGLLDKDTLVNHPHGHWESFYNNGKRKDSGTYINSLRESEWVNWYENGTIESKGTYEKNRQEGTWIYYYENGRNSTREQYFNNKIVEMECFDEEGNSTGSFCSILKPPVAILDRFTDFNTYMLDNIFWPKELDGKGVNGIVKAEYTISKEGKLTAFKILETPHELLGIETERFFRSLEKWSPAVSHNRIIEFSVTIEVPFYR